MAWWDYGYQLAGMSNRTVIIDNNTWNNTHIATVGMAFASPEAEAWNVARRLDATHVLVVSSALHHYSGDDITKFLWMARIGGSVYPWIKERDYKNDRGSYQICENAASRTMLDSLLYRLTYYRHDEVRDGDNPFGYDAARRCVIGLKGYSLEHFEEAYTSKDWVIRIFSVLPPKNRVPKMKHVSRIKFQANDEDAEGTEDDDDEIIVSEEDTEYDQQQEGINELLI